MSPSATPRPLLAVHGHFYQPERRDPFSGQVASEPGAAPYPNWNARIDAECYKPNADRGNLRHISFDLGPTLAGWLGDNDPATHEAFVAADLPEATRVPECGNALAQAYHHSILPLASMADRRTEIRWGLRDFELRFGRKAAGLWLPETAVDLPTLRIAADEGIRFTILAPWQCDDPRIDTRRPYRVALGNGRAMAVVFYDATLSSTASFDGAATVDADAFAGERVAPRLAGPGFAAAGSAGPTPYLALIATDGELYGHHQKFRDLFLARLVNPGPDAPARPFDVTTVAEAVCAVPIESLPATRIAERTSWSCHHGVLRWMAECPDAADGRWKAPLRAAFERLAGGVDAVALALTRGFMDGEAVWRARDSYVDVLFGKDAPNEFAARYVGAGAADATGATRGPGGSATDADRATLLRVMEAEGWRLAMFASDGWFWDDPVRGETKQVMKCAARAARLIDEAAGTDLEGTLVADLSLLTSPSRRVDGAAIYNEALEAAGQPTR